jgi:hypothetical protein
MTWQVPEKRQVIRKPPKILPGRVAQLAEQLTLNLIR